MNNEKLESLTNELNKLNRALKIMLTLDESLSNVNLAVCAIKREIVTIERLLKEVK